MGINKSHYSLVPLADHLRLLRTPEPPYYVVISTNIHKGEEVETYEKLIAATFEHANQYPGYLGMESAHETLEDGKVFTVAAIYFETLDSLEAWRNHQKHVAVKKDAKQRWFLEHNIRVCHLLEHYGSNLSHA